MSGTTRRRCSRFRRTRGSLAAAVSESAAREVACPLAGEHQVDNAITAALALDVLGAPLDGIAKTRVARAAGARRSRSRDHPRRRAQSRRRAGSGVVYPTVSIPDRRVWMVYGSMRDKAVEEITGTLFPLASEIVVDRAALCAGAAAGGGPRDVARVQRARGRRRSRARSNSCGRRPAQPTSCSSPDPFSWWGKRARCSYNSGFMFCIRAA